MALQILFFVQKSIDLSEIMIKMKTLQQPFSNKLLTIMAFLIRSFRRAILPHETLGTPVAKYSFTYGANWISGESLFLRKLVLGIPAQASGKNLTRPPMPSAPRFVLVTSSRPNKGSEHWLQMT